MLSGDLKWGAYLGAEAFVLPSHSENFGIVVAEALACGLPTLISALSVARRARISGGAKLSRSAALSLSTMAGGVAAGATTPSQNGAASFG